MNAIRRDEETDNLHSLYVDQWDWEKIITKKERNIDFLKDIVRKINFALIETKEIINQAFKMLTLSLNNDVFSLLLKNCYYCILILLRKREKI